jgi:lipid-A-disaccharide synthase
VTFVGHPLLDRLDSIPGREEARRILGLPPEEPVVALLPGSRANEIRRILPAMAGAAHRISRQVEGVRFVMPVASGLDPDMIESALEGAPPVIRFNAHYEELVRAASAAAVASGTATLEAALLGTPMVAVYRLHPLTYWMGRALVRVDHIAMPNLIAGRRAVPELVQGDLTPEALASELVRLLTDRDARERMEDALAEVRTKLAGPGAFPRAAAAVLSELPEGVRSSIYSSP